MVEAKAIGTSMTTVQPWRYTPFSQKSVAIQGVNSDPATDQPSRCRDVPDCFHYAPQQGEPLA